MVGEGDDGLVNPEEEEEEQQHQENTTAVFGGRGERGDREK